MKVGERKQNVCNRQRSPQLQQAKHSGIMSSQCSRSKPAERYVHAEPCGRQASQAYHPLHTFDSMTCMGCWVALQIATLAGCNHMKRSTNPSDS